MTSRNRVRKVWPNPTTVLKLSEGSRLFGFYIGPEGSEYHRFRTARGDVLVPAVRRLKFLQGRERDGYVYRIEFVNKIALPNGRSLWNLDVWVSSCVPEGVRGMLRRQGLRLLKRRRKNQPKLGDRRR